ncbi:MAG: hypothetical protein AB1640_04200 [bacterium]
MEPKRRLLTPLNAGVPQELIPELEELEARLERQVSAFPLGSPDETCLWYLCHPKCEGSKCLIVCSID